MTATSRPMSDGGRKNEDPLRPSRVAELKKPALSGLFVGWILFFFDLLCPPPCGEVINQVAPG